MANRVHPGDGPHTLTPDAKYDRAAYSVTTGANGLSQPPLADKPWSISWSDFRVVYATGWTFGWVFFDDDRYVHFAIGPPPTTIIILEEGTYS